MEGKTISIYMFGPRIFIDPTTKLMKPVFSHLRGGGGGGEVHISSGYIDDSFLVGYSILECQLNVDDTLQCFNELGFLTHDDKSVTTPTQ